MVAKGAVTVTLASGTKVTCSKEQAEKISPKKTEPKKSAAPRKRAEPTSDDE